MTVETPWRTTRGRSDPASWVVRKTRRFSVVLSTADTNAATSAGISDLMARYAVILPVATTRWRLRFRNWNAATGTVYTGVINCTGVHMGTPLFDSSGLWAGYGRFTAAPTQAVAAFTTVTDGSEYISSWVTDPTLQFAAGVVRGVSIGTITNGNTMGKGGNSNTGTYGTSGSVAATSTSAAVPVVGTGGAFFNQTGFGHVSLEVETYSNAPVVLALGDSIGAGIATGANLPGSMGPSAGYIEQAGLRHGFTVVNASLGGTQASNWVSNFASYLSPYDLTTTVPDAAVINLGTNDLNNSVSLTTFKTNMISVIASVKALGIPRVFVSTVIPRNFGATPEAARLTYNAWLRSIPAGVEGCFDVANAIEVPGTPATANPYFMETYPHPNGPGYQWMANSVQFRLGV